MSGDDWIRDATLPPTLTLDQALRAAYYLVRIYWDVEDDRSEDIMLLLAYFLGDHALESDWNEAVQRALADGDASEPRWGLGDKP